MKVLMPTFAEITLGKRWIVSVVLALIIHSVIGATPASAQSDAPLDQLFTIRGLKVDETARSANQARQVALLNAEQEAYEKLLRKITQAEDRSRLPELTVQERQALISGLEFVDDQSSSRRYLATLNVRFEPSLVSSFLASYGVPHVLSTGRPILVLHTHRRGASEYLWEADPTIDEARNSVDWLNRIRGYRFARGEIQERLAISASEVRTLDIEKAKQVSALNQLESAVLIRSEVLYRSGAKVGLRHMFLATDSGVQGGADIPISIEGEAGALAEMYEQILDVIDGAWRERLLVDTGSQGEVTVLVPSVELADYAEVERRLADVTLVQSVDVKSVGLPLSRLLIRYTGREEQLTLALRFEGLDLRPYGDEKLLELRK